MSVRSLTLERRASPVNPGVAALSARAGRDTGGVGDLPQRVPVALGEMLAGNAPAFTTSSVVGVLFLGAGANAAAFALDSNKRPLPA